MRGFPYCRCLIALVVAVAVPVAIQRFHLRALSGQLLILSRRPLILRFKLVADDGAPEDSERAADRRAGAGVAALTPDEGPGARAERAAAERSLFPFAETA